jgi:hypothetical protein
MTRVTAGNHGRLPHPFRAIGSLPPSSPPETPVCLAFSAAPPPRGGPAVFNWSVPRRFVKLNCRTLAVGLGNERRDFTAEHQRTPSRHAEKQDSAAILRELSGSAVGSSFRNRNHSEPLTASSPTAEVCIGSWWQSAARGGVGVECRETGGKGDVAVGPSSVWNRGRCWRWIM